MSQMQNFDFLPNVGSIKIPGSDDPKDEFLSEEDAVAWAKEAESAGIPPKRDEANDRGLLESEEAQNADSASTAVTSEAGAIQDETEDSISDLAAEDIPDGMSSTGMPSAGMALGDDLWSAEVATGAGAKADSALASGLAEQVPLPKPEELILSADKKEPNIQAVPEEIEIIEAELDAEAQSSELDFELSAEIADGEMAQTESTQDSYSFSTPSSGGSNATVVQSTESPDEITSKTTQSDTDAESDLDFDAQELFDDEFWNVENNDGLDPSTFEIELPSNDNIETNFGPSTATRSPRGITSIRGTTATTSAAFSAMQARAEALAAQNSFTLKGSDFGGDMDIRMRSTLKGLDLTLLPRLASQAAQLNGSLKTIKNMLKDRGVHTHSVRLNDLNLDDSAPQASAPLVDTAFFSAPVDHGSFDQAHGTNDNVVSEIAATRQKPITLVEPKKEGEQA